MTNKPKPKSPSASTQAYLDIEEIREGVVILRDGSMRAVILVSSINFDLKSEEERNSIITSFQNFLNSLAFPVQIMVNSKKIDLSGYINKLSEIQKHQKNDLLKVQTLGYMDFIQGLLEQVNIMDKNFFVVVPFYPNVIQKSGLLDKVPLMKKPPKENSSFENDKIQLMDRVDVVVGSLKSVGLNCASLDTQNLIELYYSLYNPVSSKTQKIQNPENLTSAVVTKGVKNEKEPEHLEI